MVGYEEIWDCPSLRKRITNDPNIKKCYDRLLLLTIENIIDIHHKVAKIGKTKKVGVRSWKHMNWIYEEFRKNVEDGIDLIYIVTKIMKSIVRFRPFYDVNRRTLFETGQSILRICGLEIIMSKEEAKGFKSKLRPMPFEEVFKLIQDRAKSIS